MTLEQLLNQLIELGRKPRGDDYFKIETGIDCVIVFEDTYEQAGICSIDYSLNDLCSIDSGLRQFVCGLDNDYLPFCSKCSIKLESNNDKIKGDVWYEEEVNFRLMLSSIQEDKERFLLDNIKLEGKKKD